MPCTLIRPKRAGEARVRVRILAFQGQVKAMKKRDLEQSAAMDHQKSQPSSLPRIKQPQKSLVRVNQFLI